MAQTFNGSSSSRQGSLGSMLSDARCSSNPTKFASLNEAIGHNITSINASTKQLQKLLKLIPNAKDVSVLQEQIHSINSKTNELVEITSDDLRRLQARLRHGDRQQKLQLERLTSEFQHVLVKYSEQQKRNWKVLRQSYQEAVAAEREADVSQQQRQEQADLESEHNMLVERHRQVEQLHSDIVDVHLTMNELRKLTIEQGEVVDNVETLIDRTAANVEDGCIELQTIVNRRNSTHLSPESTR
ncbi:syntaxin-12-like [Drosophila hydei]|uniref:Syntaxin-12-like n=1 Tax=Drosophila hydei TaxID=7224 RepID=A0A6J1LBM5_DROHY|nr:syntaxin-12-like [Drosophila hydei]